MFQKSIFSKVLIIFSLIGFVWLLLTFRIFTVYFHDDQFSEISERYSRELNHVNEIVDENSRQLFQDINGIIDYISNHTERGFKDETESFDSIRRILNSYCNSHKDIETAYILLNNGTQIIAVNDNFKSSYHEIDKFYIKAGSQNLFLVTPPYQKQGDHRFFSTVSQRIIDKNNMAIGIIAVEADLSRYLDFLKNINFNKNGILGLIKSGEVYIITPDEENEFVFGSDDRLLNLIKDIESGSIETIYDQSKYFVFSSISSINELQLFYLLPDKAFLDELNRMRTTAITLLILIIIVICIFGSIGSFIVVVRPIRKLNDAISPALNDITRKIILPAPGKDEVGMLNRTFAALLSELDQHREHLQELVEKKTDALLQAVASEEAAKLEALEASNKKNEFLANISHELRTPMNAIIGFSYLLKETSQTDQQLGYTLKIEKAGKTLLSLINDIIDLSNIINGNINIAEYKFRLDDVFLNLKELYSPQSFEKGLRMNFHISPDLPKYIIGDEQRLGQILMQLVSNAVKFTDEGEILIACKIKDIIDDKIDLIFTVEDSGIGMTEEQTEKLYESFSQADSSSTRKYGGAGLGLALAKQLTDLLRGDLSVKSRKDEGSVFTFNACFSVPKHNSSASELIEPDFGAGKTVLIASADSTAAESLIASLNKLDFNILTAADDSSAIKKLRQNSPDLIFYDYEFSNEELNPSTAIPIVSFSAADKPYGKKLEKPFLPTDIYELAASVLKPDKANAADSPSSESNNSGGLNNGRNILLVEDNIINQQVASELLKKRGFNVKIVDNGKEDLKFVHDTSNSMPDLILMDIQMPEMDGHTATSEIRALGYALPIIALSANVMPEDREKAFSSGMNDFIAKPVEPVELFSTISKYLALSQNNEEPEIRITETSDYSEPEPIGDITGFDTETALIRIGGNSDLYIKLLGDFHREYSDAVNEYQKLIKKDDLEPARRLIHTIKGVSGNLGAVPLQKASAELEAALKSTNPEEASISFN